MLDFGATSPSNINFLTGLGHSVYMAQTVQEAASSEWMQEPAGGGPASFALEAFSAQHLSFSGKEFDVVLLWDTINYLPPEVVPPLFARMTDLLRPGGQLLAFFHGAMQGPQTAHSRYQLTDSNELILLESDPLPLRSILQTRQIENFLAKYSSTRFFLGKDNIREVIATR